MKHPGENSRYEQARSTIHEEILRGIDLSREIPDTEVLDLIDEAITARRREGQLTV